MSVRIVFQTLPEMTCVVGDDFHLYWKATDVAKLCGYKNRHYFAGRHGHVTVDDVLYIGTSFAANKRWKKTKLIRHDRLPEKANGLNYVTRNTFCTEEYDDKMHYPLPYPKFIVGDDDPSRKSVYGRLRDFKKANSVGPIIELQKKMVQRHWRRNSQKPKNRKEYATYYKLYKNLMTHAEGECPQMNDIRSWVPLDLNIFWNVV